MNSKQIFYRNTGHDNETYIFLDKLDNGSYQVRTGHSSPVSHFEWEDDETIWICPYISRHLLSLNPLLACCRRYSRGER